MDGGEGDVDDGEGGVEDGERLILQIQFHVSTNQAGWVYPEVKYLASVSQRSKTTLKFIQKSTKTQLNFLWS